MYFVRLESSLYRHILYVPGSVHDTWYFVWYDKVQTAVALQRYVVHNEISGVVF